MRIIDQLKNYKRGASIIMDWLGAGCVPVDKETAQKRADICSVCPENVSGIRLTESIADAIKEQVALKNHIRLRVDGERRLQTCSVCNCANRLQIWCPISSFHYTSEELSERFPPNCWKRKESGL